jgi:hypothetical protein
MYGKLTVAADGSSYSFTYGDTTFQSAANATSRPTKVATGTGTHPALGPYDELALEYGTAGVLAAQYFAEADAFVFQRRPGSSSRSRGGGGGDGTQSAATDPKGPLAAQWPAFSISDQPANHTRCLGWAEHYFYLAISYHPIFF